MNDQESTGVRRYVAWGIVGLIILLGVSIATSLIFFAYRSSGSFYPFFPFFPFHFGLFGIFLIFIILLVARWVIWPRRGYYPGSSSQDNQARNILRERYAKGELTMEQFEKMMRDLKESD